MDKRQPYHHLHLWVRLPPLRKFLLSKSVWKPLFLLLADEVQEPLMTELQITNMPRLTPECMNSLPVLLSQQIP